ncbi:MAG: hypothetical protein NDI62_01635 [Burkholderiales bacterium]|nr:hypothetical protein [Burkholderiales bacterium]
MKYKKIIAILGIIFFIVILNWNSINTPFERDEGEYAYSAKILLNGGLPYKDTFLLKPPMIIYTYALGQIIDPNAIWPPRVLKIITIFGIVFLVGLIVKKEYGENADIANMYILAPMLSFPYLTSLAANTEIFMLLPLTGVVALFIFNYEKEKSSFLVLFSAGFLGITALLYKPISLLPLIFIFCIWLFKIWQNNKSIKNILLSKFFIFLGIATSLLLFLGYFLLKDGGKSFFENVITYNFYYLDAVSNNFSTLFRQINIFWSKWPLLCILLISYLFIKPKNYFIYLGLFLTSFLMIFKSNLYHYYIILIPFWAILIVGSIEYISSYLNKKYNINNSLPIISSILVISILIPIQTQFFKNPNEISTWIYGMGNPFIESKIIAQKIKEITKENDTIFIAGSEPQILFYANRKSSSRFVITYPFLIKSPVQMDYKEEAMNEILRNDPKAIVVSQREESGFVNEENPTNFKDFIYELLNKNYHLVGGYVLEKKPSWVEDLSAEQISNSSLLLYKKN